MRLERLGPDGLTDDLGELCEMLHREYDYPSEWSTEFFFDYMRPLLERGTGYFSVVCEMGVPVAICGGVAAPDPYASGDLKAYEMFWYVHPDHRRGGAGRMVFEDWEKWAREQGCKRVTMCHLTDMNPAVAKAYEARGYRPVEIHYWKELD